MLAASHRLPVDTRHPGIGGPLVAEGAFVERCPVERLPVGADTLIVCRPDLRGQIAAGERLAMHDSFRVLSLTQQVPGRSNNSSSCSSSRKITGSLAAAWSIKASCRASIFLEIGACATAGRPAVSKATTIKTDLTAVPHKSGSRRGGGLSGTEIPSPADRFVPVVRSKASRCRQ